MKTVAVGLSGGVDSTLTALLLQEQGYRVIGLSMSIYNKDIPSLKPSGRSCYGPSEKQDIKDIAKWAKAHGIESHIIDLSEEYKQVVLAYFKECYLSGRTPNPCIMCNEKMKFGLLADKAHQMGVDFDYFATGHYARIEHRGDRYILRRAIDEKKDQSYFLYRLNQKQLSRTLFPLGGWTKEHTRELARARGLVQAEKAESQDFYAGDYTDLLEQAPRPGNIVLTTGQIVGKHMGFWNYTVGQRKGLGVAHPEPLFVVDVDADNNQVIVGRGQETQTESCYVAQCNWVALETAPVNSLSVSVKYRSAGVAVPATIVQESQGVRIRFDAPQRAVSKGQSAVFYDGDIVLGGGIIE